MYKKYNGVKNENVLIKEHFNGDFNIVAKTLGYNDFNEVLEENSKSYNFNKYNPFLMNEMDILIERIYYHIQNQSNILVFGDFDVDGISSSAVMLKGLSYSGAENLDVIIPTREIGYSIKREYIIEYLNTPGKIKPDVIITVDCGIKSKDDIEYIVDRLGIEVLVTDHHGVDETMIPTKATACVNPHRAESQYPFQEISGSLVALKVIEALDLYVYNAYKKQVFVTGPNGNPNLIMQELQDLAMLGTISDVMPIVDENKLLVRSSLSELGKTPNIGLRVFTNELADAYNNTKGQYLTTSFIGWQIGPRINAAGRIGNPTLGLYMFLVDNVNTAKHIFASLDSINKERQEITKSDVESAVSNIKDTIDYNNGICYINGETMDGVIGLVAGRLKEAYYKPAIAIGGRSTNIDLVYQGNITEEMEYELFGFLFKINELFNKKNNINLFYGVSIQKKQNNYHIMFSADEKYIKYIEDEIFNALSDLENFIKSNFSNEKSQNDIMCMIRELKALEMKLFTIKYTNVYKGSCRSIEGFDITKNLDFMNKEYFNQTGEKLLLGFGGHPMAAGFGIEESKIEDFKNMFENVCNSYISKETLKRELTVNLEIDDFSLITETFISNIYSMGPYGNGNEFPSIMIKGRIKNAETIGKTGQTLKLLIEDERGGTIEGLVFRYKLDENLGKIYDMFIKNTNNIKKEKIGLIGTLEISEFNNIKKIQLRPMDLVMEL